MAGGAGVEYYFGYMLPQNDLNCEDWRSRDKSWDYCRIALHCFYNNHIPFWEMQNENSLVGNIQNENSKYCLAKPGEIYVVYLPDGGSAELDLGNSHSVFKVQWFNPRKGGLLQAGSMKEVSGPGYISLGEPPKDKAKDWVILINK